MFCTMGDWITTLRQWRSQNRIVARAQVGHIYNAAQHAKVSVRKHALLGGLGACPPPQEILEFRTSEIASAVFSGRVSVAKIRIPMQYSGSALVAIQLSRNSCEMTRMLGRESCSGTCPGVPGLGYATALRV